MLLYSDLTYAINGAAFHVHNKAILTRLSSIKKEHPFNPSNLWSN